MQLAVEIEQSMFTKELACTFFLEQEEKWGRKAQRGKEANIFVSYNRHKNSCSFKEINCYCNFGGYCFKGECYLEGFFPTDLWHCEQLCSFTAYHSTLS